MASISRPCPRVLSGVAAVVNCACVGATPTGPDGAQGPPGEVTNAAVSAAISGTSSNTNAVATLGTALTPRHAAALRARGDRGATHCEHQRNERHDHRR